MNEEPDATPELGTVPKRSKVAMGESKKRGCTCSFRVKIHKDMSEEVLLIYDHIQHVNEEGVMAHQYTTSNVKDGIHSGHTISPAMKHFIALSIAMCKGRAGMVDLLQDARKYVLRIHAQMNQLDDQDMLERWDAQPWTVPDDYKVNRVDIQRQLDAYHEGCWKKHQSVSQSIHSWAISNGHKVLVYKPYIPGEQQFQLVIQSKWQRERAVKYGHNAPLGMDSTFGVNTQKWPLTTLMVIDEFGHGLPVAWSIMYGGLSHDHYEVMLDAVRKSAQAVMPEWRPSCIIIDDCQAEINAIRAVFGGDINIVLCVWHVLRAWKKNAITHCDAMCCHQVFVDLASIMYANIAGVSDEGLVPHVKGMLEAYYTKWATRAPRYVKYVKDNWASKVHLWVKGMRTFNTANQQTNNICESFHNTMKSYLGVKKKSL